MIEKRTKYTLLLQNQTERDNQVEVEEKNKKMIYNCVKKMKRIRFRFFSGFQAAPQKWWVSSIFWSPFWSLPCIRVDFILFGQPPTYSWLNVLTELDMNINAARLIYSSIDFDSINHAQDIDCYYEAGKHCVFDLFSIICQNFFSFLFFGWLVRSTVNIQFSVKETCYVNSYSFHCYRQLGYFYLNVWKFDGRTRLDRGFIKNSVNRIRCPSSNRRMRTWSLQLLIWMVLFIYQE